jgi:hypothetical protein
VNGKIDLTGLIDTTILRKLQKQQGGFDRALEGAR